MSRAAQDMSDLFKELDDCPTPIGAPGMRRRRDLRHPLTGRGFTRTVDLARAAAA
ncbi:hypothetical protein [Rhodovulum steppense]|uniref:hypothetical protein n=1 Tax=Rhodovulum steppense TaxID=540251 RepID=UPI0014053650|nr:hypothetical protein [Rhodovulum steppense]